MGQHREFESYIERVRVEQDTLGDFPSGDIIRLGGAEEAEDFDNKVAPPRNLNGSYDVPYFRMDQVHPFTLPGREPYLIIRPEYNTAVEHLDKLHQNRLGRPQGVTICGQPGIGKW